MATTETLTRFEVPQAQSAVMAGVEVIQQGPTIGESLMPQVGETEYALLQEEAIIIDRLLTKANFRSPHSRAAFIRLANRMFEVEDLVSSATSDERPMLEKPDAHFIAIMRGLSQRAIRKS